MKLNDFANELKENKEDKVIEPSKITAEELMPKLNEYKKLLEGTDPTQALAQAKAYLQKADPTATITQKGDKYALQYNGKVELYDLENLVKRCIAIGTAVKGDALKTKMPL